MMDFDYRTRLQKSSKSVRSVRLASTMQQYFSLKTNQPQATSEEYFSLRTNQHQPSATEQDGRL
jgi:hypothetical protein